MLKKNQFINTAQTDRGFFCKNMALKHRDRKICREKVCLFWSLGWRKLMKPFCFFHECSNMKIESRNSYAFFSLSQWPSSYLSTHSPSIISGCTTNTRRCRLPWTICLNDLWVIRFPIRHAELRMEPLTFHGVSLVIKNISMIKISILFSFLLT